MNSLKVMGTFAELLNCFMGARPKKIFFY